VHYSWGYYRGSQTFWSMLRVMCCVFSEHIDQKAKIFTMHYSGTYGICMWSCFLERWIKGWPTHTWHGFHYDPWRNFIHLKSKIKSWRMPIKGRNKLNRLELCGGRYSKSSNIIFEFHQFKPSLCLFHSLVNFYWNVLSIAFASSL